VRQGGFTQIIALAIVAVLGGLVYFSYTKGYPTQLLGIMSRKTVTVSPSPFTTNLEPIATLYQTDNWKTYTYKNEGVGYTVTYPTDWEAINEVYAKPQQSTNFEYQVETSPNDTLGLEMPQILIQISNKDNLDYVKKFNTQNLGLRKYGILEGTLYSWKDVYSWNNYSFDQIGLDFVTYVDTNNILFRLFTTSQNKVKSEEAFYQMISTFKFTP